MDYPPDFVRGIADLPAKPDTVVEWAQQLLTDRGYSVGRDRPGIVGAGTLDAVETYRIHHDLPIVRVLDSALLDALQDEGRVAPVNEESSEASMSDRVAVLEDENATLREALISKSLVTEADLRTKTRAIR